MSTVVVATVKSNSSSPPAFQNTSGTEIGTLCRAWVNFNGTGTVAIRASFNVSSITDLGVGSYRVNFSTALADTNYALSGFLQSNSVVSIVVPDIAANFDATFASIRAISQTGSLYDTPLFCASIFR